MDEIMAGLAIGYWTQFGKTNNPNGDRRTGLRYEWGVDRILHKFRAQCCDGSAESQARRVPSGRSANQ
jgi:hypothetical protein